MLKRLYVDNYKCLVNFEITLAPATLLVGLNGTGKSSVFEILSHIRSLVSGTATATELFPSSSLTMWQANRLQTVEIEVEGGPERRETCLYRLGLAHEDGDRRRCRIAEERLESNGTPLFELAEGEVRLHDADGNPGPVFPFDGERSGLSIVGERHDNPRLSWFKRWLADLQALQVDPTAMASRTDQEISHPSDRLGDFASWYRHLAQEKPVEIAELFGALRELIETFEGLELAQSGESTRTLNARFAMNGTRYRLRFDQLSDGQRTLIALHTLLHMSTADATLCIDEPESHVALAEIQPLIYEFCDRCDNGGPQVIFASHHPELIDHPGITQKLLLWRDNGAQTRSELLDARATPGLSLSETVARGWE